MDVDILLGKTKDHLVPLEGTSCFIHKQVLADFTRLQKEAANEGFDLQVISGFRDFERQKKIWNLKASGERPILDDQERTLDFLSLSPSEVLFAILRWSALPGCSRHHWGTDIDVFDAHTQAAQDVKLIPSECVGDGPAARFHDWLDAKILSGRSYGFYRPYSTDRGGVSPERWHLSYAPLSQKFLDFYTYSLFEKNINENDILLKDVILENADEIFQRFIRNIDLP